MFLQMFKAYIVPLGILIVVNMLAAGWRAIPYTVTNKAHDGSWQSIELGVANPDVRELLLAGGYWGRQEAEIIDRGGKAGYTDIKVTAQELEQHIQTQLQGIIHRDGWVLLFANSAGSRVAASTQANTEESKVQSAPVSLPLELRSGDVLPNTDWYIGDVWPDRIQLLQDGHESLVVPLYPLVKPLSEP